MRGNGSYSELFSAGSGNRYLPVTASCKCISHTVMVVDMLGFMVNPEDIVS